MNPKIRNRTLWIGGALALTGLLLAWGAGSTRVSMHDGSGTATTLPAVSSGPPSEWQGLAVMAAAGAWLLDAIPLAPVVAVAAVAIFNVVGVRGSVKRGVVIGLQQMIFGIVIVAVTAIAVLA